MNNYIYISHSGMTVYLSDHRLSYKEAHCPTCDECDTLVAECYDEEEVRVMLRILCRIYDLYTPNGDYDELVNKYGLEDILHGGSKT